MELLTRSLNTRGLKGAAVALLAATLIVIVAAVLGALPIILVDALLR